MRQCVKPQYVDNFAGFYCRIVCILNLGSSDAAIGVLVLRTKNTVINRYFCAKLSGDGRN